MTPSLDRGVAVSAQSDRGPECPLRPGRSLLGALADATPGRGRTALPSGEAGKHDVLNAT